MLCIKFRFGVRLLFFKKLWPAFQPSKALVGRNGKADVFCRRRKTVFDLISPMLYIFLSMRYWLTASIILFLPLIPIYIASY